MIITKEFKKKYMKLGRKEREAVKDALGIQFHIEFIQRKLKERKSWISDHGGSD